MVKQNRVAILGQVLPLFFKHMETHVAYTPMRMVKQMPPIARKRLGFPPEAWFRHPSRFLQMSRPPHEGILYLLDLLISGPPNRKNINFPADNKNFPAGVNPLFVLLLELIAQPSRSIAIGAVMAPFIAWSCGRCCCSCCCCCCR